MDKLKTRTALFLLSSLLLAAVATSCVKEDESAGEENYIVAGSTIPPFTVSGPYGAFDSGDFDDRGGLLVLFASYCGDCQRALVTLNEVYEAMTEDDDFEFVLLSRQTNSENETSVRNYWTKMNYGMPYYLDPAGEVFNKFANINIPRAYIIDRNGKVTWMAITNLGVSSEDLLKMLRKI